MSKWKCGSVSGAAAGRPRRLSGDDGTSLVELMIGMMLMLIFMGMFTSAVVMMNTAMNKAQAVNLSSSQLNVAFSNLDTTVRYAAAISRPGQGLSGDWYVELRTTNTGVEVCTQLRMNVADSQLQRKTWTVGVVSAPLFVPLASGLTVDATLSDPSTKPFFLPPAGNAVVQQLTFNLQSPAGNASAQTTSVSTFTFTALNSTVPVPTSPICQQQGRP